MIAFTLITGNAGKRREWQRLIPYSVQMATQSIDLEEIQSFDSAEIVAHKVRQAYDMVGGPVVVEDVSAGLDRLKGLPGPYMKAFEQRLGDGALFILAGSKKAAAVVSCTIAYYDGVRQITAYGEVAGKVVAPRGDDGFGFDKVFMPSGVTKTFAQMTPAEKDALSHRHLAILDLLQQLEQL